MAEDRNQPNNQGLLLFGFPNGYMPTIAWLASYQ